MASTPPNNPSAHIRWRKVGESVTSEYTNTERKEVWIDPCECIKKLMAAAEKLAASPVKDDIYGDKKAKAMRPLRGVRRFNADVKAYEFAKAAEAVYWDTPPGRWAIATEEQVKACGLEGSRDLEISTVKSNGDVIKSEFKAQIYIPKNLMFCEPMPAVLAFKGTTISSLADWMQNARQGMDMEAEYYRQAVELGRFLKYARRPIAVTGHSLGGGLASACAVASGKDGWTFNSAGLHPNTVARYGANPQKPAIQAYRHEGEVLTAVQEPDWRGRFAKVLVPPLLGAWVGGPMGVVIGAWVSKKLHEVPAALGTQHTIACLKDEWSGVDRHGMANTLMSFNHLLRDTELALHKETCVNCSQPVIV